MNRAIEKHRSNSQTTCAASRSAFTLLELLLVLGILVLMVGLAWPALRSSMTKNRLRDSAQQLRVELARARLLAMENGVPLEFRYRAGEGRFRIALRPVSDDALTGGVSASQASGSSSARDTASAVPDGASEFSESDFTELHLPEGVVFAEPQISWLDRGPAAAADEEEDLDAEDQSLQSEGWSAAIIFLPDGTASDATLALRDDHGAQVVVQLRGVTGLAKPGEIEASEAVENSSQPVTEAPVKTASPGSGRMLR